MKTFAAVLAVVALSAWSHAEELRVELMVNKPARVTTASWPLSVGVPFAAGQCKDVDELTVVDEQGHPVASQVTRTGSWDDQSLRWALVDFQPEFSKRYFLTRGEAPDSQPDDIRIEQDADGITIDTTAATYIFRRGQGCFDEIRVGDSSLASGAGDAFYVVDSQGRRSVLRSSDTRIEMTGRRHAVVRVEGDYLTADGQRNAAGVVYFHFYAGLPAVKLSHKLIVTEPTQSLWFRDIGIELPLNLTGGEVTATFNSDHADLTARQTIPLNAEATAQMVQHTMPHFGQTTSRGTIEQAGQIVREIPAVGDWLDVGTNDSGLAAQIPALAEQFPKALLAHRQKLIVKLWAGSETGSELDFRTEQIIKNYFGHDWIPADHAVTKVANNAQGTAKTHDVWLYPRRNTLDDTAVRNFAATREGIFAMPDPGWIAATQVMGPWHPKDPQRYPQVEEAIDDYFTRAIFVSQKVFPPNGYLYYGCYPYVAQPWEIKNGRWYPTIHRLSRCLEYNLKRSIWILAARSADPRYVHYARRYTRFMHDIGFANAAIDGKPEFKGRLFQYQTFDSPVVWGGSGAYVTFASSEDVIQFVYDYFLSGDFHSRDMALHWKRAMIDETQWDVEKGVRNYFPAVILLRPIGSVYELDRDPKILDYGSKLLGRMVSNDPERVLNEDVRQNYGKMGETMVAFYYYYVSTGDRRALDVLLKLARHCYRFGRVEDVLSRQDKALPEAFSYQFRETKDPAYAQYLAQWMNEFAGTSRTLAKRGLSDETFSPQSTEDWGPKTITNQDAIGIGLPVAMRALLDYDGPRPTLPIAAKSFPTHKTYLVMKKESDAEALIDVYINNTGDRELSPRLTDSSGREIAMQVVDHASHRQIVPGGDAGGMPEHSIWYNTYESHLYYRLRIPTGTAAGVYTLDVGSEVSFIVLRSDIDKMLHVAPDGLVLQRGTRYFFPVPAAADALEFFAHRPVRVFNPSGEEVAVERDKQGRCRVATAGRAGAWAIMTGTDSFVFDQVTPVDTFVRFGNIPMVLAAHDAGRLFDFDAGAYPSAIAKDLPKVSADQPFAPGRFGEAAVLGNRHVRVPLTADASLPPADRFPYARGTVEFWFRPLWSLTDAEFSRTTIRLQSFAMDPIQIWFFGDPDNSGRTGRFTIGRMDVLFNQTAHPRARLYFEAGKWYHIAVTWNFDGENSFSNIFINGRQRAYYHYDEGISPKLTTAKLGPLDTAARFGSGHAHFGGEGEIYDELRISRSIRYTEDFQPPDKPFETDDDTYLLMHLDGDTNALLDGQPVQGQWGTGNRLKN